MKIEKHYILHQAVITPQNTTTKIIIVCNASAKTVILEDLCGLLGRFGMK